VITNSAAGIEYGPGNREMTAEAAAAPAVINILASVTGSIYATQ